tara:strand:- start:55 stop:996 length:942 start_codon:yes stop_codon:yes gene_type:complete
MNELRKDYILNRWVIIAEDRKKRPREFKKEESKKINKTCYFCPGNEKLTPKETGRLEYKGGWKVRWFPNMFPFVTLDLKKPKSTRSLKKSSAYGYHEVIVETPDHSKQLSDLSEDDIRNILMVYAIRIKELSEEKNVKYVLVFKNHGREAGTSLIHSHTQLSTLDMIPSQIKEEMDAVKKQKTCPYCSIIEKESESKRKILENDNFIAFAPFASRFNYEAWLFPKKHILNITQFKGKELLNLAIILKKILLKLKSINASYNLCLHYGFKERGMDLHFHIEIQPRIATWGGFENSSGMIINSVSPESAAKFYRN